LPSLASPRGTRMSPSCVMRCGEASGGHLRHLASWPPHERRLPCYRRAAPRPRWVVAEVEPRDGAPIPCGGTSVAAHASSRSRFCPLGKSRRRRYSSALNCGTKFLAKDPKPVVINCGACGARYMTQANWLESAAEFHCRCGARLKADTGLFSDSQRRDGAPGDHVALASRVGTR